MAISEATVAAVISELIDLSDEVNNKAINLQGVNLPSESDMLAVVEGARNTYEKAVTAYKVYKLFNYM